MFLIVTNKKHCDCERDNSRGVHGKWDFPLEWDSRGIPAGMEIVFEQDGNGNGNVTNNMEVRTVNACSVPKSFPRISQTTLHYTLCSLFATFTQSRFMHVWVSALMGVSLSNDAIVLYCEQQCCICTATCSDCSRNISHSLTH